MLEDASCGPFRKNKRSVPLELLLSNNTQIRLAPDLLVPIQATVLTNKTIKLQLPSPEV